MIITENTGKTLYIADNKILWARADESTLEIAISETHGLNTYWTYKTSRAHEIAHDLENGLEVFFVEEA